jgi:hypothetical protein
MMKWTNHSLYFMFFFIIISITGCAKNVTETQPLSKNASIPAVDNFASLVTFSSDEFANWKSSSPAKIYNKNTIFDYIDGAAELYFAYDFSSVATAEYKNDQTSILIDVYDMTTPENAFGIYSLNKYQEANYVKIGNEGILTESTLDFWKGKYYCKVYSLDQSKEYQKIVADFGNKLASRIQENGEEPEIIGKLPQKGLIPKTEKFFTRKLGLDNVHFISEENVLDLNGDTKGAIAEYQSGNNRFLLFVIDYHSPEKATKVFDMYSKYLNKKGDVVLIKDSDGKTFKVENKFTHITLKGQFLSGFWDVESQELAEIALQYMVIPAENS